jgi:hypothetical protein
MECTPEQSEHLRQASSLLRLVPAKRPRQCEHIKTNGEFCGSPALRGRNYCYFHLTNIGHRLRAGRNHARAQANSPETAVVPLELPPFEDAHSIQTALMKVVDALLHNRIDTKRAGLVLYALQTASSNLARCGDFQQSEDATVAGRYDDFEEDFELGDDVPDLKIDEAEEERKDDEYTTATQMERVMEACATLEQAKREAVAAKNIEIDEDGEEKFHCNPVSGLFCSIMGPLSKHYEADQEHSQNERDAASQRLELLPTLTTGSNPVSSSSKTRKARGKKGRTLAA